MTWYVYALKDPRNGAIRYVGKSLNPAQRMHAHRSRVGSAKVRAWIHSLESKGAAPELMILHRCSSETESLLEERKTIAALRADGASLLNTSPGSDVRRGPTANPFGDPGSRVRQARTRRGLSVRSLGRLSGVDPTTISNIENGKRPNMAAFTAVQLARSLDCSVEWLVTGEGCQARTEAA